MAKKFAEAVGKPTGEKRKKANSIILKKRPDYKKFEANNWIKESARDNEMIQAIDKAGGAIWLTAKGDVAFRVAPDVDHTTDSARKAEIVLGNLIGKGVKILRRSEPDITEADLILTVDEVFEPLANSEFLQRGQGLVSQHLFAHRVYEAHRRAQK